MSVECQESCVRRLLDKINDQADEIVCFEEEGTDGAEVVVLTYGITARVTRLAIDIARQQGVKVGFLRLIVLWPFPEKRIRELAGSVGAIVVPEINYGQMVLEVERCAAGRCAVIPATHGGGGVHDPTVIAKKIIEAGVAAA
jgi:2-oxoglutarate ferredoxin oxidoreductase subunit alpha